MAEDYFNLSDNDKEELQLIELQLCGNIILLYSDFISLQATLAGKELVLNRYTNNRNISNQSVDEISLQSLFFLVFGKIILYNVGITWYNILGQRSLEGEWNYSLEPNILINFANSIGLTGNIYSIIASMEIYKRDVSAPVFGIR